MIRRKRVKQYFDLKAHRYNSRTKSRFRDIPNFIENNIKNGILLDLGCGKGDFVNYIAYNFHGIITVGLDVSKEMLSSRERSESNFILGEVIWLPFRNGLVDMIYMDTLLHHIIDNTISTSRNLQRKSVKEALKVLK